MRIWDQVFLRFRSLLGREQVESELDEELRFHLEHEFERNLAAGMTAEAARLAARRAVGGLDQIKEQCRDTRRVRWIENLLQDTRYALRGLRKSPGFLFVAIAALALGIGANTAVFSIVNAVLLRPLPYPQADRLVQLWKSGVVDEGGDWVSYPDYQDYRRYQHSFEDLALYRYWPFSIGGGDRPESLIGVFVSPNMFDVLRVQPAFGRGFLKGEDEAGRDHVVVISDNLWQRRFHGDRSVIGSQVRVDGGLFTIIGVMPPGFSFPLNIPTPGSAAARGMDIWAALGQSQRFDDRGNRNYWAIGRLSPGVSLAQAKADMDGIGRRLAEQYPRTNRNTSVTVTGVLEHINEQIRPALLVLLTAISLVLLIACANIANLLLARSVLRKREIAIRAAIGASRGRIFAQLLTESVVLAVIGGAVGVGISEIITAGILRVSPNVARMDQVDLDPRVLLFTAAISILTGIVFGALPAWHGSRAGLATSMKSAGAHRRSGPLAALVAAEVAVALVLLTGAGLMIRSFINLVRVDPGFNPRGVITGWIMLPQQRYSEPAAQARFFENVVDALQKTPGVDAAGAVNALPLTGINDGAGVRIAGSTKPVSVDHRVVAGSYFRVLRMPLLVGRYFDSRDRSDSTLVCIVSEALANRLWPGQDPIGRQLSIGSSHGAMVWRTVAGVVKDVAHYGVDLPSKATIYLPAVQDPDIFMQVAVRAKADPAAIGDAIARATAKMDREQPVFNIERMEASLERSIGKRRFETFVLIAFASLAMVLASVGIYGVTAFAVNRRSQEIGIRMSLGARPGTVLRMVLVEGMRWAATGILIGLAIAFAVTRLLSSSLFGVGFSDPLTFLVVVGVITLVSLVANYIPARRALQVDPVAALRSE